MSVRINRSERPFSVARLAEPLRLTHGNPVNYVDPSGEFICGGLCLAAAVVVIAGGIAFTADYSFQTHENMQAGMNFWDAAYYQNHNWGRTAFVTGEAMALATIGVGLGLAVGALGITGTAAWVLGGVADVAVGTAWEMGVYDRSFGSSLGGNLFSFGLGEIAGYGLGRAARGLGQNADAVVARRLADLDADFRAAEARRFVERAGRTHIGDLPQWQSSGVNLRMQQYLPGFDGPPEGLHPLEGRFGTYDDLFEMNTRAGVTNLLTPHHMPADSYMKSYTGPLSFEPNSQRYFTKYTHGIGSAFNTSFDIHRYANTTYRGPVSLTEAPYLALVRDVENLRFQYQLKFQDYPNSYAILNYLNDQLNKYIAYSSSRFGTFR